MAPRKELLESLGEGLGDAVLEVGEKVVDAAPVLRETGAEPEVQPPEHRLSAGVVRRGGTAAPAVFVEKPSDWSVREARRITSSVSSRVAVVEIGEAYSAWPTKGVSGFTGANQLFPGFSVSHFTAYAGSIGCFVQARVGRRDHLGFLGSSHVLASMNLARRGDPVLAPGYPDGPKTLETQIGTLENFAYLVHHRERRPRGQSLNTTDVAFVALLDESDCPPFNLVPMATRPDHSKKIKDVVELEEVPKYLGKKVFKSGRTTGWTRGTFEGHSTEPHTIELPDGNRYIYEHLFLIKGIRGDFSQPGDSGSLIYTSDTRALGLIVGASSKYTLAAPLTLCLGAMNAQILGED